MQAGVNQEWGAERRDGKRGREERACRPTRQTENVGDSTALNCEKSKLLPPTVRILSEIISDPVIELSQIGSNW